MAIVTGEKGVEGKDGRDGSNGMDGKDGTNGAPGPAGRYSFIHSNEINTLKFGNFCFRDYLKINLELKYLIFDQIKVYIFN